MNKPSPSNNFLRDQVKASLHQYFSLLDGVAPTDIYNLVLSEVVPALLEVVLEYTQGNQSKAAAWLGVNRGTLRKLLQKHGLET